MMKKIAGPLFGAAFLLACAFAAQAKALDVLREVGVAD